MDPLTSKRVLVCGGRDFSDAALLLYTLDRYAPSLVIHGGYRGADSLAGQWADKTGTPCMVFPAAWSHFDNRAGPIRNSWMLKLSGPELVLAFPGDRGTADMVAKAEKAGVPVVKIGWGD